MLSHYFGFREEPFGATPDPRWLYRSSSHREALASLKYGFYTNRGFTALIAPPGMGKTTLLFQFLHDIWNSARCVFLFDTQCDPPGLLRYILRDLGVTPATTGDEMHEQLQEVLIKEARAGRKVVIVVDEAQNLSDEALEMLRLLTNFETPQAKLLQIVLSGQPLLADRLEKQSQEPLRQRVSTIGMLEPFSMDETTAYIRHRLEQAGYRGAPLFRKDALKRITIASHGNPRLINNLCFSALSLCCALKRKQVDGSMAAEAIADQEQIRQSTEAVALSEAAAAQEPLQPLGVLQPEQNPQAEEWQPPEWARRLLITAAAVLLASGLGLFMLFAHQQSLARLTDSIQSPATKVLSASAEPAATANTGNVTVTEPPANTKPSSAKAQSAPGPAPGTIDLSNKTVAEPPQATPSETRDQLASIPAPAPASAGKVTLTKPPSRTAPSAARVLSSRIPAPALANIGKVAITDPPSKTTPSAPKALSLPIPAPAPANIGRVAVALPSAKTASSAAKALSSPSPAPAMANIGKVTVAEPSAKTTPSAAKLLSTAIPAPSTANMGKVAVALPVSKTAPSATKIQSASIPAPAIANPGKVAAAEPPSKTKPFQITVGPNQTLQDICVRYLGVWDQKRLHEIQALNPNLTDLDHIPAGLKIWLPAPEPAPMAPKATLLANGDDEP